jgi:hypothetical protein
MLEELIGMVASRIASHVLITVEKELKRMTQAVDNLTTAVDGAVAEFTALDDGREHRGCGARCGARCWPTSIRPSKRRPIG